MRINKYKHSLFRLTESIYGKPQLIREAEFSSVIKFLNDRNNGEFLSLSKEELSLFEQRREGRNVAYNADTKVGVIQIDGALTYKMYVPVCGEEVCSYEGIKNDFNALVENGAKIVVLEIDSGGGEAYQAFETADYIRTKAKENDIKIISYVDGLAASAAYALASIADEIIVNPQAEVGSIGVVCKLMNTNKAYEQMGVETTYVYAGKSKIPFSEDGSFTESFISDLQTKVDALYETFIDHVSGYRNMSKDDVKNTEAKTFLPTEAISLGLADKKMTLDEYHDYIADLADGLNEQTKQTTNFGDIIKMDKTQVEMSELQTRLKVALEDNAKLEASVESLTKSLAVETDKNQKLEATIKESKTSARKKELSEVLPQDKVDAVLTSCEALSDDAFSTIVASYATSQATRKDSSLFTQQSSTGTPIEQKTEFSVDDLVAAALEKSGVKA